MHCCLLVSSTAASEKSTLRAHSKIGKAFDRQAPKLKSSDIWQPKTSVPSSTKICSQFLNRGFTYGVCARRHYYFFLRADTYVSMEVATFGSGSDYNVFSFEYSLESLGFNLRSGEGLLYLIFSAVSLCNYSDGTLSQATSSFFQFFL